MSTTQLPPLPGDLPPVVDARRLSGGDVGTVWLARLEDDRTVVVKRGPGDASLEAEGLEALRAAGAETPAVLGVDADVLVLEYVFGTGDVAELGRRLAQVHTTRGPAFGWDRDNLIGPLAQANPWTDDWPTFFAEHRLDPHLDVLPRELRQRLNAAIEDGRLARRADHEVTPSLVHGDLWGGNILHDRWLIDPAVHYADREVDLAMLELFGAVSAQLLKGYEQVWPLDDGVDARRELLQLYPLLVHVRLFGSGYLPAVAARLDRLGW